MPTALINRIEVVSVGGAPIYGSDAIAGTINVILKDDFEGFEVDLSAGWAEGENDGSDYKASFTLGTNFAQDRGNIVMSFERNKTDAILMNDRPFTKDYYHFYGNPDSKGPNDGITDRIFGKGRSIAILTKQGVPTPRDRTAFLGDNGIKDAEGNTLGFGDDGRLRPIVFGKPTSSAVNFIGGEGLLLQDYDSIRAPIERDLFNALGHFNINNHVELYGELNYYTAESSDPNAQPFYQYANFGGDSSGLPISIDNPYISAEDRAALIASGIPNDGVFYLQKAMSDLSRGGRTGGENEMLRLVAGARGDFTVASRDFSWDFSYNRGKSESVSNRTQLVQSNYEKALDVVESEDGSIACRSGGDCVPLNPMGIVTDNAAISYVTTQANTYGELTQDIISLSGSGELFDMHGGAMAVAIGVEKRDEEASFMPDDFLREGLGRTAALSPLSGAFDTTEGYFETLLPILGSGVVPTLDGIEIEGAWRHVDHSQSGSDQTWTYGARFMFDIPVVGRLVFKAAETESIRAPALTEALLPLSQSFSGANDPCDRDHIDKGESPARRLENCKAEAASAGFTYDPNSYESEIDDATKKGFKGGNEGLVNERAESSTWGVIWQPGFVDNMEMSVDWVNIDINEAIVKLSLTTLMEACYDGLQGNSACNDFTRDENFQVTTFETGFRNAGFYNFRGVDIKFNYNFTLQELMSVPGEFDLRVNAFHIKEQQYSVTGKDLTINRNEIGFSKWKGSIDLAYTLEDLTVSWRSIYIGSAVVSTDDKAETRDIPRVPDYWRHNAYAKYSINENLSASLSVRNIFDEEPPTAVNSFAAVGVYDVIGRYVTAGVKYKF